MGPLLRVLAPVALLLSLACQPQGPAVVYGPWEEGLTLAYEDPSQPQPQRSQNRLQVRVAKSSMAPGLPRLVQVDLTSLRGQLSLRMEHAEGGLRLLGEDGQAVAQLLPTGFPNTTTWVDRGMACQVLGRATWSGAALLPATADPVGVWVEARAAQGPHRRTLYLPNLGEVETQELRGTDWITVNRLVSRGFTDLPTRTRP